MLFRNQASSPAALSYFDNFADNSADVLLLIGRILLGWIFVRSGFGKLFDISGVAASFPARGIPAFMAYISVPVEFFGGLALMFGFATRYAAVLMSVFMLVATFTSHRYWTFTDLPVRRIQEMNFYKNMAMLGGFFFLFVADAGRISLDGWLGKSK
jgi:putative oxidoreductase